MISFLLMFIGISIDHIIVVKIVDADTALSMQESEQDKTKGDSEVTIMWKYSLSFLLH